MEGYERSLVLVALAVDSQANVLSDDYSYRNFKRL